MPQQMFENPMMQQRNNPMMMQQPRNPMMQGYPPMMQNVMGKNGPQPMMGNPMMQKGGPMMNMMNNPGMNQMGGKGQKGFPPSQQKVQNNMNDGPKRVLGERIYSAVSRMQPDLAGKITGMLLDMDPQEILSALDNESLLRMKVDEA